jgi:hypothetical protein
MRRFFPLAPAVLALFPFTVATASAASDSGSWWLAADAWFAELSNVNLDVALETDLTLDSGGEVIGLDYGAEFSGRIRGGWQSDDPSSNGYSIMYWSWDEDESIDEGRGDETVFPTLSDPVLANSISGRVESEVNVQAMILDVMMSRRMLATRRASWTWGAGLRYAKMEQEWDTLYVDPFDLGDPNRAESVAISSESKGAGLTGGIEGSFRWHRRLRTSGRVQFALLRGEMEAKYRDEGFLQRRNRLFVHRRTVKTGIDRDDEDRVQQQIELEARISYRVWRSLDVSLGYWFLNWSDVLQVDRFTDDWQGGLSFEQEGAAFNGFVFSVSYLFE